MPRRSRAAFVIVSGCALALGGCGGGGSPPPRTVEADSGAIEAGRFLRDYGAEHTDLLREPDESIETLEQRMRETRGAKRLAIMRDVAVAHMLEADGADAAGDARQARRHRHKASRIVQRALRWNRGRDAQLTAELSFVRLWTSWKAGTHARAEAVGERFVTRRREAAGELLPIAWIIRGEAAFEHERWDRARDAYRYLLGKLGHPLYAFALYRTAQCLRHLDRGDEAREMLEEVVQLGCRDGVAEHTMRVAERAATETDTPMRTEADGRRRPASCPKTTTGGNTTPSSGEELPPALQ